MHIIDDRNCIALSSQMASIERIDFGLIVLALDLLTFELKSESFLKLINNIFLLLTADTINKMV
jgi:hypothetical protein